MEKFKTEFKPNYAIHPGELLKDDLNTLNISLKELSEKMKVDENIIQEIIDGGRNIDLDIAEKLGMVMGPSAEYWLNAQKFYYETILRLISEGVKNV